MSLKISEMKKKISPDWDSYVKSHPLGNIYQLSGWKTVIENAYHHKAYYLLATNQKNDGQSNKKQSFKTLTNHDDNEVASGNFQYPSGSSNLPSSGQDQNSTGIVGILPLIHIKQFLFGNSLISIPFCDLGGVLAG